MAGTKTSKDCKQRGNSMTNENSILLKLTEILEKENLISVHERNRVVELLEKKEII